MRFSAKQRRGFTLIELLVSIAIVGILSAIMVTGLVQQKNISLARRTAEKLQNDIQAMQNNALSGQQVTGVNVGGFGVYIAVPQGLDYKLFADASGTGYTPSLFDTGATPDPVLSTVTLPSEMRISGMTGVRKSDSVSVAYNRGDLVYTSPNAKATLYGGASDALSSLTIILKNLKLNVCYAVTITAASGTVSNRQYQGSC